MRWDRHRARATAGVTLFVSVVLTTACPTVALDEAGSTSPDPTQVPSVSESGRPDLYLEMPYYLGGFEPEIVMTRGEEHFAGLAADDPVRRELEDLLSAVGAEVDDFVTGYALVAQDDFFSFVVAIRVDGVTPGTLLPAYLPLLTDDLVDPQVTTGTAGGKAVVVVSSVGADDESVDLYVYDEGDTIWMVQGPRDVVEMTLSDLPEPLPAKGLLAE
jgi:hypothetical protein